MIEKEIGELRESIWTFKNVYRLENAKSCHLISGNSETIGIKDELGQALAFSVYQTTSGKLCEKNNPCEVEGDVISHG